MLDIVPLTIIPLFLLQLLITVIVESLVLYRFGYHKLQACFAFVTLANLLSLVVGALLLLNFSASLLVDNSVSWKSLALIFGVAVIIEFVVLRLCQRGFSSGRLVLPVLLMNLLSLIPLYFLVLS